MAGPMGRRRRHDLDLPPLVYCRRRGGSVRYYYGREGIALGGDLRTALRRYADLAGAEATNETFGEAARLYIREELAKRAPKTQSEYGRQLALLVRTFGKVPLGQIRPRDVAEYLRLRPAIAGTREKALLSAVINFARRRGLTDAPNPCAGVRGVKSRRHRYVTDAELADAIARADPVLAGYLELCYLTGQRPGDVCRMRRSDVQDGALWVVQAKTKARVRIAIVGPLEALLARLTAQPVGSLYLVRDERGQPLTLAALRKRFARLGVDWQIRDLRAKAASDSSSSREAQALLGHAAASTTDGYIRAAAGATATPIMREIRLDGKK